MLLGIGAILVIITMVDFFGAFASFQDDPFQSRGPRLFFLGFIGLPMVGIGLAMSGSGYARELGKYSARQARPGVRDMTSAVREGWDGGDDQRRCPECGESIEPGDRFCDRCGTSLAAERVCTCGESNDADAKFCSACGKPMTA